MESKSQDGSKQHSNASERNAADRNVGQGAQREDKYEQAWLDLARSSRNREEAIAAVDHALEINPGSIEARNLRISLQMSDLKATVGPTLSTYRPSRLSRLAPYLSVGLVILLLGAASLWILSIIQSRPEQAAVVSVAPTLQVQVLPATWTPSPSPSPTLSPSPAPQRILSAHGGVVGVIGKVSGTCQAFDGPSSIFPVVGIFTGTVTIPVKATSQDRAFYEVQPDNYDKPVWVAASRIEFVAGDAAELPVLVAPTPVASPPGMTMKSQPMLVITLGKEIPG